MFHAFCHDITVAQRATRFAAVVSTVVRSLAEAASSITAAARVVEALGTGMGWPVAELWVVDEERQLLTCAARHTEPGRTLDSFCLDELALGTCLAGRVHHAGAPQWIPDLAAQIGQDLQRRRAEELAVELARTKDGFLAMVTHELRNPLAVITSTAALADEELDTLSADEQRHYLHTIARSAQRLAVMTEDLLDLASLESGHLCIHPTRCDLGPIIDQAVQAMHIAIGDKHLTVTAQLPAP